MKKIFLLVALPLLLLPSLALAQPAWQSLKEKVIAADRAGSRREEKKLAQEALQMAETCLAQNPNEWGCLYYRAQASGLSNRSWFGYVGRVRAMLSDWEKVLAADPTFDYGGPYRMIAEVYMELPKNFGPKDLRQDLNKSVTYLKKAIAISDYPTNWLDLAEAYSLLGKVELADKALVEAKKHIPQWREDPYFKNYHMVPGTIW